MKMNVKSVFAAFAAFAVVLSCTKVEGPVDDSTDGVQDEVTDPSEQIIISATLSDVMTKVAFTPSFDADGKTESLALVWEADDKLRIYNHDDKAQFKDFELDEKYVGQKTGVFKGTVFDAASYDVEIINGDLAYATQTQPSDGVTSSLKYLASASEVTDLSAITFTEYSSVLSISAKMPEGVAGNVTSVDITASEAIFNAGNSLTIALDAKGDKDADNILHLFANLPKGDQQIPEGTTLLVHFNAPDTDHTVYTRYVELDASAFTAGKLNTININASKSDKHAGLATCDGSSAEKAYLIGDKYQMQAMHELMTEEATTYFMMIDDVDLAGIDWEPLNLVDPWSKGIYFDGADHTVSNFSSNAETYDYPSFAGILNGTICNVTFDKANVQCAGKKGGVIAGYFGHKNKALKGHCINVVIKNSVVNSAAMAGVFAAQGDNVGTLSDCSVIDTEITSTGARVGGFIGSLVQADKISGCTAENVTVSSDSYLVGGFAGNVAGGVFENCTVSGSVTSKSYKAGGFIGNMDAGTLTNCSASADVTSTSYGAGGLVGYMIAGTLTDCSASGDVNSTSYSVGGLVGNMVDGSLTECTASGNVQAGKSSANYSFAGGLIGQLESGTITQCYSISSVGAEGMNIGGLIGYMQGGSVIKSYASGSVAPSADYAGGLIGVMNSGEVNGCYSTIGINCNFQYLGGLIGAIVAGSVTKCYATGDITASAHYTGGLIGQTTGTVNITQSYSSGTLSPYQNSKGGIVGQISKGITTVTDCYTTCAIECRSYSGCFIGRVESGATLNVKNSYSCSTIKGHADAACVFTGLASGTIECKGFVGWNLSGVKNWSYNTTSSVAPDGNYMGTDGTISAKALEYGWDPTIWDLSGDVPVLK